MPESTPLPAPEGAALRLAIDGDGHRQSVSVFDGGSAAPLWQLDLDPSAVAALIGELSEALKEIHDLTGNALDVSAPDSAEAEDMLLDFSRNVSYGLFGEHPGLLYNQAGWRAARVLNPAFPPEIVEVTSPGNFFYPFELLCWQDAPDGRPPDDPAIRARLLLGMSAVVRRHIGEPEASPEPLPNKERLRVTAFRNRSLTAARKETDYLKEECGNLVDVYGPWPGDHGLPRRSAVRHIVDSRVPMDSEPWEGPAAVLHLACHCNSTGNNDRHRTLDVGGDNGLITLSQLKGEMAGKGKATRPLVFLNACGSSAPQAADRSAFTEFLVKGHYLGVLGTFFDISDKVAAHFAMVFYEALLSGARVGRAMYEARWHLMELHRNPLGLLYTFHGNVDLHVDDPRAGQVEPACDMPRAPLTV
jgi:hypothetical protein